MKPFTISVPDARLIALQQKVAQFDWDRLPDTGGWRSGVGKADLRRLVEHWLTRFDWRAVERRLNALPHFITEVAGEPLHFIHARGDGRKPPVLLLHGWPGSFIEFEALIAPLAADGHDVVVPSLPGFAFSTPIADLVGPRQAGERLQALMQQLFGSTRYVAQGGDWGAHIASWMAHDRPDALLGIHLNMVNILAQGTAPTTPEVQDLLARREALLDRESGYSHEQRTRPQTLGVALADSPVGAAAWILEKFGQWADLPTRDDGSPDLWARFDEDTLLTNIMLYLATPAVVTAQWIYQGQQEEGSTQFAAGTRVNTPVGIAAFPDPVFLPTPHSLAEQTYNVVHYSTPPKGGHFAALEQPALMLAGLRAFIVSLAGGRA
ncbi:epoxide hydrolase 1 [Pseudomonas entomophila]|uniref:epoxide hydrolase family protein n=1 Tax=Pseudomonas entomophila TaxID=312306 RepID=UPI0015E34FE4|nr:epoxide hydrolase [Pseudomonas entomophila]MBA1195304.1 epoxide hydrolase 1 [Pseudomonas entomophila]